MAPLPPLNVDDVRICTLGIISDAIEIVAEEELVEEVVVPDFFEEAKALFEIQVPNFLIVVVEESKTVQIDFILNPDFESVSLEADFGKADGFV